MDTRTGRVWISLCKERIDVSAERGEVRGEEDRQDRSAPSHQEDGKENQDGIALGLMHGMPRPGTPQPDSTTGGGRRAGDPSRNGT
mmetsp:Transcript_60698/g.190281  ORF Transcript_60698/g.190281 Transcript_60698/m.190281 type:complete len:86 (-) Transcript_60698:37-294(-)